MDFALTPEEVLLQDTCRRLFAGADPSEASARAGESRVWRSIAEMGLTGLHVPEAAGGQASSQHDSAVHTFLVCQAAGRALLDIPYAAAAVEAAPLVLDVMDDAMRNATLADLLSGRTRGSIAHDEGTADMTCMEVGTVAHACGQTYVLCGTKHGIAHGSHADYFIVSARLEEEATEQPGLSLFLVPGNSSGVRLQAHEPSGLDADLHLNNVVVPSGWRIGSKGDALASLRSAVARGIAARLAEAVGIMERLLEMSVHHLRTRRQFGKPLADFQALQHQLADMATSLEMSTSMALMAASHCAQPASESSWQHLSAAKAFVGRHGLALAKKAVQLHGGMGMTEELLVGKGFRRLIAIDAEGGNHAAHLKRFGASLLVEH